MATAAAERQVRPAVIEESAATKVVRVLTKTPVYIVLVVIGVLWLIPTLGLFFTSLLGAEEVAEGGWWRVLSEPSKMTWENYSNLFDNEGMVGAIVRTVWITVGATVLPVLIAALAGYALA